MGLILNVDLCKCKVSHGHGHGHGHGHSHGPSRQMVKMRRKSRDGHERLTSNTDDSDEDMDTADATQSDGGANKQKNIMIRAAFVHVVGDLVQSIGVLIAATIIYILVS